MKITKLHITNFKSIKELELINPNPFSVFVGPNGAGKSNIFEALEFCVFLIKFGFSDAVKLFGGGKSILNFNASSHRQDFILEGMIHDYIYNMSVSYDNRSDDIVYMGGGSSLPIVNAGDYNHLDKSDSDFEQGVKKFSRIFLNNSDIKRFNSNDDSVLSLDASNTEKVLQRTLQNQNTRDEIIEWLQVLIPEFKDIQIEKSNLSGEVNYAIYEKHTNKPFPKHLISDGTKNILALLTAVYQSDEPQFLCIEEPENGLHPYVIESLVNLFRTACKEKGHYIWLNTHSQTLVRQLTVDEIIVVDKKEGSTRVRQFNGANLHGLKMDEAWLTNALGGGLP